MGKIIKFQDYINKKIDNKKLTQKRRIQLSYDWAEQVLEMLQTQHPPEIDKNAIWFSFLKYSSQALRKNGWKDKEIIEIVSNIK